MPSERQVSFAEFEQHLNNLRMPRMIDEVIVHHTEEPRAAQYRGLSTIQGVRRYHMQVRGWSDNGYHIMIAPNADIWLCRPLERAGGHCLGHNAHSVGLSYIANFDAEDPRSYGGMVTGQRVVQAVLKRFGLGVKAVHFHREFADKTCPGMKLDLTTYRKEVEQMSQELQIVVEPARKMIPCHARLESDTTRVDLRALAEGLGYEVVDRIREEGKVVVREGGA